MKIAVVGGGIAGYLAATHVSHHIPNADLFHIYDPAVPAIGVGEGTLPFFRRWLDRITGLSFAELQAQCGITWKKGIRCSSDGDRLRPIREPHGRLPDRTAGSLSFR
jgi:tryptophan halogenase